MVVFVGWFIPFLKKQKMNRKLLKRIEELFEAKLMSKTGWGRNEVMAIYRESVNEAILELIE